MSVTRNAQRGTGSRLASHPQTNDAQCDRQISLEVKSKFSHGPPPCTSDHRTDATVLGLGAAGGLGGRWRGAVVVGPVSGMGRVCRVAPVAMRCVWVRRVGRLRLGRVVLVRRVLQVGRRVVVVVVMVRRGVLSHLAELGVVRVRGCRRVCVRPGRVVQVGGVRGVGDEGGVQGLRGGAGGLHPPPGAEQRSEQRGGVGQGLAAVAGRAVSAGGGSPPHVRTANDGPLQERGGSDHSRDTAAQRLL